MTLPELPELPAMLNHPWVRAGLMVLASLVAARLFDLIITRFLTRWARRSDTTVDDHLIRLLHRPIFMTVLLFGVGLALEELQFTDRLSNLAHALFGTTIILVWVSVVFAGGDTALHAISRNPNRAEFLNPKSLPLFTNLLKVTALGVAVYLMLAAWKVDPSAWLASAGIMGIALGFAAKDTLANLFAGVFIMADAPYQIGDYVNLDSGERGEVSHIGLRSTRLITRDDIEITIPNAVIGNAKIVNESRGRWVKHRIRIPVGVAYGSDIDLVEAVLLRVGQDHKMISSNPEPRVRFRSFGESGLDFELLGWISDPATRGLVRHELNTAIYKAFAEESVEIPFPQRDLHVRSMPREMMPEARDVPDDS